MTKTRYRIYTEYVHTRHIAEIVNKYFDSYSMFSGIGFWKGAKERSLVIEVIVDAVEPDPIDIIAICREINTVNHQKCCLVTSEQVDVIMVSERVPA